MIPFAILSGNFIFDGNITSEFCILDLSVDSFTFRLPEPFCPGQFPNAFLLHFLHFSESRYFDLLLSDFEIREEKPEEEDPHSDSERDVNPYRAEISRGKLNEESGISALSLSDFCTCYRVTTESADFFRLSMQLQKEYQNYVTLKISLPQAEVSRELTGYPSAGEDHFAAGWALQKAELIARLHPDSAWSSLKLPPCGFLLDCPSAWKNYLSESLPDFASGFFHREGLSAHPLAACRPKFLYIGNSFCPHLFPDDSTLQKLLCKAWKENLLPVLQLAPASESILSGYESLFIHCSRIWESHSVNVNVDGKYSSSLLPLEIVVNDWGTLQLITEINQREGPSFPVILGPLLQKRRKDPRLPYHLAARYDSSPLTTHLLNAGFYIDHLQSAYPLSGVLFESCGYPYQLPSFSPEPSGKKIHKDLLLPFYQTNTATACTLRAAAVYGDRGKQAADDFCPCYCEELAFLYPEFLRMVGRYNSLFGFDHKILEDSAYMASFLDQGIDRLIFQFL